MIIKEVKLKFKFVRTPNHKEKIKQKWKKFQMCSLVNKVI